MESKIFINDFWGIWQVVPETLLVSVLILGLGIIGGLALYGLKGSHSWISRHIANIYISYFRGVPLLIHLLVTYYGLPIVLKAITVVTHWNIDTNRLNPIFAIIISYTLYTSAFISEIIRGSFKSVGTDQSEAAISAGYTNWQAVRYIRIPQALSEAVPKFLNYFVLLIRQLSLAFIVSFVDIFAKSKLESAINYRYIESFCAAALVYWILCAVLTMLFSRYEKYLRRYDKEAIV